MEDSDDASKHNDSVEEQHTEAEGATGADGAAALGAGVPTPAPAAPAKQPPPAQGGPLWEAAVGSRAQGQMPIKVV
jgi:hypothetical protein